MAISVDAVVSGQEDGALGSNQSLAMTVAEGATAIIYTCAASSGSGISSVTWSEGATDTGAHVVTSPHASGYMYHHGWIGGPTPGAGTITFQYTHNCHKINGAISLFGSPTTQFYADTYIGAGNPVFATNVDGGIGINGVLTDGPTAYGDGTSWFARWQGGPDYLNMWYSATYTLIPGTSKECGFATTGFTQIGLAFDGLLSAGRYRTNSVAGF